MAGRAESARENGKKGGRPKGSKSQGTLATEAAREHLRARLTAEIDTFVDALVSRARGVRHFNARNKKTGKWELVTSAGRVVAALNSEDGESGEFYTEKPDIQAIREGFDRMVGRSQQSEHKLDVTVNHEAELLRLLDEGRKRSAERAKLIPHRR